MPRNTTFPPPNGGSAFLFSLHRKTDRSRSSFTRNPYPLDGYSGVKITRREMLAAGGALFNSLCWREGRERGYLHYKLEGVPSSVSRTSFAGQNGRHADHSRITRVEVDEGRARSISKDISPPPHFLSPDYSSSLWIIAIPNVVIFLFRVLFIQDFRISK